MTLKTASNYRKTLFLQDIVAVPQQLIVDRNAGTDKIHVTYERELSNAAQHKAMTAPKRGVKKKKGVRMIYEIQ